jgi:hypothetical protein
MRKIIIYFAAALISMSACAKMPERPSMPQVKFESELGKDKVIYRLSLSAGIRNENSGRGLKNCTGQIVLGESKALLVMPFKIDVIFPFENYMLGLSHVGDEGSMSPLFDLFQVNRDSIIENKTTEQIDVNDRYIQLKGMDCDSESIYNVLEEKSGKKGVK